MLKTLNINARINANANFPGIVSAVLDIDRIMNRQGKTFGGLTRPQGVSAIRANCYKLGTIDTWVKASKRMKRELGLIGVGKYLKNEASN